MNRHRALRAITTLVSRLEEKLANPGIASSNAGSYYRAEHAALRWIIENFFEPPQRPVIADLRKLWSEASPGKWHVVDAPWGDGTWVIAGDPDPHAGKFVADCQVLVEDGEDEAIVQYELANAKLIATAKQVVPALCDRVEFLERALREICDDIETGKVKIQVAPRILYSKTQRERLGL